MPDTLAGHEKRIGKLESWRDGNGLPGAAATIQYNDARLDKIEAHQILEPQLLQAELAKALSTRSKSKEGMIRALGPYFAALCTIAAAAVVLLK